MDDRERNERIGREQQIARNRVGWDLRAEVHRGSGFYDVEGFKAGRSSLRAFEVDAVGDVRGKKLLHLMCHFGLDTLSWARLGAEVTGVGFLGRGGGGGAAAGPGGGLSAGW